MCVVIVAGTTQRYSRLASVFHFCILLINPNIDLELEYILESVDSSDLLRVRKYSQLFTHESNTFRIHTVEDWTECTQTHTQTHKVKTAYPPVSFRSLGGYNNNHVVSKAVKHRKITH